MVIIGLQLHQLQRLLSATTGIKLYVASASNNSYYMNLNDFSSSFDRLYISGNYLPSRSGSYYVNRYDDQVITGIKYFIDEVYTPNLVGFDGNFGITRNYINVLNGELYKSGDLNYGLSWFDRICKDSSNVVAINWQDRLLSGAWTAQSLTIPNNFDSVNRKLTNSLGAEVFNWNLGTVTVSVPLTVSSTTELDNKINTSSMILGTGAGTATIEWGNSKLVNSGVAALDWKNKIISGDWTFNGNYSTFNSVPVAYSGVNFYHGGFFRMLYQPQDSIFNVYNSPASGNSNLVCDFWEYILKNGVDGNTSVDWGNRGLYTDVGGLSQNWNDRKLYNSSADVTVNYESKLLSGAWTAEQLHGFKIILTGNPPTSSSSPGISGQLAMNGSSFFVHTGIGWGKVQLTTF